MLPLLDQRPEVRPSIFRGFKSRSDRWAEPILIRHLTESDPSTVAAAAYALARIRAHSAIPAMIDAMKADAPGHPTHSIGSALARLTGTRRDDTHDGVWWEAWWQENRTRFENQNR